MTQTRRPTPLLNQVAWQLGLVLVLAGIAAMIVLAVINGGPLEGLIFGIGLLIFVAGALVYAHVRMTRSFRKTE